MKRKHGYYVWLVDGNKSLWYIIRYVGEDLCYYSSYHTTAAKYTWENIVLNYSEVTLINNDRLLEEYGDEIKLIQDYIGE